MEKYNADKPADQRITYISDFTSTHLTEWRASWHGNSDVTNHQRWWRVKGFFNFCNSRGWIDDNPTCGISAIKVARGNRTATFTDQQYAQILKAIPLYARENVPDATRTAWRRRLMVFTELLRWTGMAPVDAVLYSPSLVDSKGVLTYRRQMSGELAILPLPDHVRILLRDIPLERDSVGPEMPFRSRTSTLASDTSKWAHRYDALFRLTGIREARTDRRTRKPHPYMFRDTFAVWYLTKGISIFTVSRMLGRSKTQTTEKSYLPWVKEMQEYHINEARKAQQAIAKIMVGKNLDIDAEKIKAETAAA